MALQNFIDKVTTVATSWLNSVDVLLDTVFGSATTKAQARVALFPTPTDGNFIVGDGTDWTNEAGATALESLGIPTAIGSMGMPHNISLSASVNNNALTMAIKTSSGTDASATDKIRIPFRSSTLSNGGIVWRNITSSLSLVISSGSTLGHRSGVAQTTYWYLLDNSGTVEVSASSKFFGMHGVVSTTAEGAAGGADSSTIMYSTTARTNVAFTCIGYTEDTQVTAGTWAATPTTVQMSPFTSSIYFDGIGTWSNSQHNAHIRINLDDLDSDAMFTAVQGGNRATETLIIGARVPSTATVYQANGIGVYTEDNSGTVNVVSGYFQAKAAVNSGNIFGLNVLTYDAASVTGCRMQNELDFNVVNTGTIVNGLTFKGASTAQPTDATAIIIDLLGTGIEWVLGISIIDGMVSRRAIEIGTGAFSNSSANAPLAIKQQANNEDTILLERRTNTAPTGYFIRCLNADNTTVLFNVGITGNVDTAGNYYVNGTQVVTSRQTAVADASGGATVDAEARTAINALLARMRTHGLIAT